MEFEKLDLKILQKNYDKLKKEVLNNEFNEKRYHIFEKNIKKSKKSAYHL